MTDRNKAECPSCGALVRFKKPPVLGQLANCKNCHIRLEVVDRSPLMLTWASDDDLYEQPVPRRNKERSPRHVAREENDL